MGKICQEYPVIMFVSCYVVTITRMTAIVRCCLLLFTLTCIIDSFSPLGSKQWLSHPQWRPTGYTVLDVPAVCPRCPGRGCDLRGVGGTWWPVYTNHTSGFLPRDGLRPPSLCGWLQNKRRFLSQRCWYQRCVYVLPPPNTVHIMAVACKKKWTV